MYAAKKYKLTKILIAYIHNHDNFFTGWFSLLSATVCYVGEQTVGDNNVDRGFKWHLLDGDTRDLCQCTKLYVKGMLLDLPNGLPGLTGCDDTNSM